MSFSVEVCHFVLNCVSFSVEVCHLVLMFVLFSGDFVYLFCLFIFLDVLRCSENNSFVADLLYTGCTYFCTCNLIGLEK